MNSKETVVITVGVFDFFHLGHLNILKEAKSYGTQLVVGVHNDIENTKGVDFLYNLNERMSIVDSIKCVDVVMSYERVDLLLQSTDFDVFVHGPDQNHQYFQKAFEYCRLNNKKIVELDRTEGISSTNLRAILANKEI